MWNSIKDTIKTCWKLYKEKKAQKAACADNSAESESLSTEGASETNDDVGDSESSDSNVQSWFIDFTNSARRVPDTGKVKTETPKSQKTQKGARNGLQETPDRGEVRREADVRGRLPDTPWY